MPIWRKGNTLKTTVASVECPPQTTFSEETTAMQTHVIISYDGTNNEDDARGDELDHYDTSRRDVGGEPRLGRRRA